jgi:hypothetical protein
MNGGVDFDAETLRRRDKRRDETLILLKFYLRASASQRLRVDGPAYKLTGRLRNARAYIIAVDDFRHC